MFELHNSYIIILFFQHNYFNNSTKLFSNLYVAKFFNISAKFFFCVKFNYMENGEYLKKN